MLEKVRPAGMTNCPPYNVQLYVERQPITNTMITHLLQKIIDSRYKRSVIIEGSGKSGKSCLVGNICSRCTSSPRDQHVSSIINNHELIVLVVNPDDLKPNLAQPYNEPEDLFLPVVNTLLTTVRQRYPSLLGQLPGYTQNSVDIQSNLTAIIMSLKSITPVPYLLILFDGMEEVVEESNRLAAQDVRLQQNDLLYRFEKTCIMPLFKHDNTRLLATRRADVAAQWRTFTVKPRTIVWQLPDFSSADPVEPTGNDPVMEQFTKRVHATGQQLSPAQIQQSFQRLQAQLPSYGWEHAGANDCLMDAWLRDGEITKAALRACIDNLLLSPTRIPLQPRTESWLFLLIEHYPDLPTGVSVAEIGNFIQIGNVGLTAFLGELHSRGIGFFGDYQFRVYPHIVTLIREWQQRP